MIDKDDPRLTDFVLGELDAQSHAEIQAQIDQNPELAAAVAEIQQVVGLVGESFLSEPALQLTDAQKSELNEVNLKSGLEPGEGAELNLKESVSNSNAGLTKAVIALAACLLVMAGGWWIISKPLGHNAVATRMEPAGELADGADVTNAAESDEGLALIQGNLDPEVRFNKAAPVPGRDLATKSAGGSQVASAHGQSAGQSFRGTPPDAFSKSISKKHSAPALARGATADRTKTDASTMELGFDDDRLAMEQQPSKGGESYFSPASPMDSFKPGAGSVESRKQARQSLAQQPNPAPAVDVNSGKSSALSEMAIADQKNANEGSAGGEAYGIADAQVVELGKQGGGAMGGSFRDPLDRDEGQLDMKDGGRGGMMGGMGGGSVDSEIMGRNPGGGGGLGGEDDRGGMAGESATDWADTGMPSGDEFGVDLRGGSDVAGDAEFWNMRSGREYRSPSTQVESGEALDAITRGEDGREYFNAGGEASSELAQKPQTLNRQNETSRELAGGPAMGRRGISSLDSKEELLLRELEKKARGGVESEGVESEGVESEGAKSENVKVDEEAMSFGNESAKGNLADGKFEQHKLAEQLGSDFMLLSQAKLISKPPRIENRTRIVQSKEGPVEEASQVEVPLPESDYEVELIPALTPIMAKELALMITNSVDPVGNSEIQILAAIPETVVGATISSAQPKINDLTKDQYGLDTGIIVLDAADPSLKKIKKYVDELAAKNNVPVKLYAKIPWQSQVQQELDLRNRVVRRANTWKRVKAEPNTNRLMIGDDDELVMNGMQVNVQVDGFRARVLVDCFYYNDRDRQLEGNFKIRLPDDASLYYFAFGESAYDYAPDLNWAKKNDWAKNEFDDETEFVSLQPDKIRDQRNDDWRNSKEARMVPREKAAFAYNQTVRRKVDPALVEWSGAGIFNARVFPLSPKKMHRIVLGYDVNLTRTADGWTYALDLPQEFGECQVDVNVQKPEGTTVQIEPAEEAKTLKAKNADSDRHRWTNPKTRTIRLNIKRESDVLLLDSKDEDSQFWGFQMTPDLPVESVAGNAGAIFMLDTSLSSNPDKFNVWLKMLRSTLENNRDSLTQFNVLFFDVGSSFWREDYVPNTAENIESLLNDCQNITLEGATDLYGAFEEMANAKWLSSESTDGKLIVPDVFLLTDGAANWGETNLRLIQNQATKKNFGNLFAYQTGFTGTAISALRFLANESGGAVFSIATEDEIKTASTAHRNRPWKLSSIAAAGARDIMTAGRVEWVYPGQALTIVGRGKPVGELKVELSQAGQSKTVLAKPIVIESELASRLYGQVAVGQLEGLGNMIDIASSYARHFRVTGQTCSLLMLETEAEYKRFGIKPEEDLVVIKAREASRIVAETLQNFSAEIADRKSQLLGWVKRLETMPGMDFKIPVALGLVMEGIEVEAISQPLQCDPRTIQTGNDAYRAELAKPELNYDVIEAESNRRAASSVDEAIKVLSCLVERNPGDLVIARDVAFTSMKLDRPAQAYPLLLNVAKARPYDASVYPAIGQCLARLGQADMAVLFYEIALAANFENRGEDFRKIVSADYLHLLRRVAKGELKTAIPEFAATRQRTLQDTLGFETADLLVTMMWNTDQTDVDLHIGEPSGEECSYENKSTRIGGKITSDITTGFGPEMYTLPKAMAGKYEVKVLLFANNQSRVSLRNKVHLTIYKGFGTPQESVTWKTIQLKSVGEKESVGTVGVGK